MNRRDYLFDVLDGKECGRVPVGFWFHFVPDALTKHNEQTIEKNLAGHKRYYEKFHPDFLKIMDDGFFLYPSEVLNHIREAADLDKVQATHPEKWMGDQVNLVKQITDLYGKEVAAFYTIFSPATHIWFALREQQSGLTLGQLAKENPTGFKHAVDELSIDLCELAKRVIHEGHADGLYFSSRGIEGVDSKTFRELVSPAELRILQTANELSKYNLLHICGYEGFRNDLAIYVDYPAKGVNWAVNTENVDLLTGKTLFAGKAVIGGFGHTPKDVLYRGSREEVKAETKRILYHAGKRGVILGADCTVPADIDTERFQWVREAAEELLQEREQIC